VTKFKVGDVVVGVGNIHKFGRPKARVIEKVYPPNKDGIVAYGGQWWKSTEDNLVLESEFVWPSDLEMRLADKKNQASIDKDFFDFIEGHSKGDK